MKPGKKLYLFTGFLCAFAFLILGFFAFRRRSDVTNAQKEQPVTFTFFTHTDNELLEVCDNDLNNSVFYQKLEELTNVHIEWVYSLDSLKNLHRFDQDTGKTPDLISAYGYNSVFGSLSMDEAIDSGKLLDLTELVPKYAPNYYKLIQNSPMQKIAYTESGRIAAIYSIKQEAQKPYAGLQIRRDWLDELGLSVPVTYADWEEVLTAFKEKKGATAPLFIPNTGYNSLDHDLSAGFQVGSGFYHIGDTVSYGPARKEWKDYLMLMHRWYEKGLIDPNYATSSGLYPEKEMIASGTSGAWFGLYTFPSSINAIDPEIDIIAVEAPRQKEGDTLHLRMPDSYTDNYLCISSSCPDPALALSWIDFLFSEEGALLANYGIENETYTINEDGDPVFTDVILNNPDGLSFTQALKAYTLPPGLPVSYADWKREFQSIPADDIGMCDIWASADTEYMLPPNLSFPSEKSSRLNAIMAKAAACVNEYTNAFIMGIESFDHYDVYLQKLKDCGIDEAVQIYQEAYTKYLQKDETYE